MSKVKIVVEIGLAERELEVDSSLKDLDLSENIFTGIDLGFVREMDSLEVLNLRKNPIYSIDLTPLRFVGLKELRLDKNRLTTIDLTPLSDCYEFRYLNLSDNPLETIDLSPLGNNRNLESLSIFDTFLSSIDLKPLSECPSLTLRYLRLDRNRIHRIDLWPLASCEVLTELSLSENELTELDLSPLSKCTNLRHLGIGNNPFKEIDLFPLAQCTRLSILYIASSQLRTLDLSSLASCIELDSLWLMNNSLQTLDLSPLSDCTNLQSLDIQGNQIPAVDISPLFACKNLRSLYLDPKIEVIALSALREFDEIPPPIRELLSQMKWIEPETTAIDISDAQSLFGTEVFEKLNAIIEMISNESEMTKDIRNTIEDFTNIQQTVLDKVDVNYQLLFRSLQLLLRMDLDNSKGRMRIIDELEKLALRQDADPSLWSKIKGKMGTLADGADLIQLFQLILVAMQSISS